VNSAAGANALRFAMRVYKIKMIASAVWVLMTVTGAILTGVTWPLMIAVAAFGLLPPLALLLWWNEPAQTMSQVIAEGRRRKH